MIEIIGVIFLGIMLILTLIAMWPRDYRPNIKEKKDA